MISIYNIKPQFQKLLKPVLDNLYKKNITANQITIFACFFSLVIGLLFWFSDFNKLFLLALPIGLFIRMALNALDGMMARNYDQMSKKGELLNEVGDIVSDVFVFFPLIKYQPESLYLVAIFIILSLINEFAGVMGIVISNKRRYEGPMGKSDRAFLLGLYGILGFLSINISEYSIYIFGIINILLIISTYARLTKSLKET